MNKKYRSDAMSAIHETMSALYEIKAVNKQTMTKFDESCLTPICPLSPEEIRDLRTHENVSQAVFAYYLNVTTGLISKWERGEKIPSGPSLKLLSIVKQKGLVAVL
jgi:putative transcriptional regulator